MSACAYMQQTRAHASLLGSKLGASKLSPLGDQLLPVDSPLVHRLEVRDRVQVTVCCTLLVVSPKHGHFTSTLCNVYG